MLGDTKEDGIYLTTLPARVDIQLSCSFPNSITLSFTKPSGIAGFEWSVKTISNTDITKTINAITPNKLNPTITLTKDELDPNTVYIFEVTSP